MTKVFEPLLDSALIYIDDILLFSPDEESHKQLLERFYKICDQHGIMLSSRKSQIGTTEVDFLGMHFAQGKYVPQPHIAEELPKFPDENMTTKQIQQFLGILNYIRDFLPHVSKDTTKLSKLLKKNAPPWGAEQTEAVKRLKQAARNPPPLKIPGEGKRILQTDASDQYWGAVLIEEVEGQKFYCGHASGQFKPAELHYHTTYKETLAVKYGIQKFDFHLRGHQFEVHLDNSSFPKLLEFKNKIPPSPQILRLKEWFSRYDFSVKHIKGTQNLIPDFLSRPSQAQTKPITIIASTHCYPLIMMNTYPSSFTEESIVQKTFPPEIPLGTPLTPKYLQEFARSHMSLYLNRSIQAHNLVPQPTWLSPVAPYLTIFTIFMGTTFAESDMWYLWCASMLYSYPILCPAYKLRKFLSDPENKSSLLWNALQWFSPVSWWIKEIDRELSRFNVWKLDDDQLDSFISVFIVRRPYFQHPQTKLLWTQNHARVYTLLPNLKALIRDNEPPFYKENLIFHLQEINGVDEDDATCTQPLDLICPLSMIPSISEAPAGDLEAGQTSTATDKNPMQDQIMQDSQDPDGDIKDPEDILLEAEIEAYRKKEEKAERANYNLSPSHEPIFKW